MTKFPFKNVIFLMQKRFSTSTSTTPVAVSASPLEPSSSFTVQHLVNSFGLPLQSAIAVSQRINLSDKNIPKYDSLLNLFRSHGFDHTHIAAVLKKRPALFTDYKVDETLRPKLEYLALNGFSGSHLHHLIVSNPNILASSLISAIKPSLEFLRSLLGTEERALLAVKRCPWLLNKNLEGKLQPNVDLLMKEGVPLDSIIKFFIIHPYLMIPSIHRLVSALETAKHQLGIKPSDRLFLVAVTRIAALGVPLWEKKTQVLKSYGFSQQQVFCIFRRYPNCMSSSEETLRTKLDFYLATVKLKLDDLVTYPNMLGCAIDTRARPRHNVLKLLLSKKLLKEDAKLAYIFTISEDKFLNKYIIAHLLQIPTLLQMYNNDKLAKKIVTSSQTSETESYYFDIPSALSMLNSFNKLLVQHVYTREVLQSLTRIQNISRVAMRWKILILDNYWKWNRNKWLLSYV